MEEINFNNNKSDILASALKSLASMVPYVGGPIAEIIGYVIPNQRLDRLTRFIETLREKVDGIEDEINKRSKNDPLFLDFFEDELTQVSRALTEERIEYLSNLLINGINSDEAELIAAKQLLRLLGQLNDAEIIWLNYYYIDHKEKRNFAEKNPKILQPIPRHLGMDEKTYKASVIQENFKQRLEELHLIESKIKFDNKTGQPQPNFLKNGFETKSTQITPLGRQLIEIITVFTE